MGGTCETEKGGGADGGGGECPRTKSREQTRKGHCHCRKAAVIFGRAMLKTGNIVEISGRR